MTVSAPAHDAPIVIVGAGPVGMLLAYQLDRLNVPCILAEQNLHTTQWPKLDLTNCRSMELLRVLGLADEYRSQEGSVGADAPFITHWVSRLDGKGHLLGAWNLPSANGQRSEIEQTNDGTQPAEPGQRCMQIVFEAWLKKLILGKSNIHSHFGWKYLHHVETEDGVRATFRDHHGAEHTIASRYLVACDGGGSRVRKTAGIKMVGGPMYAGPMPLKMYLVHFRSRKWGVERPFGRFWHAFGSHGGFFLDQNDDDIFTAHYPVHLLPEGPVDPRDVVFRTLAGIGDRHEIEIDEIFVHSEWTPNFSIAEQYHTDSLKVLLAGDAAHRNPPHGGYGMNSGVVDAIDLGWRLAALTKGYGGESLLRSYSIERRPMMLRALERAWRHAVEHIKVSGMYPEDRNRIDDDTPEAEDLRRRMGAFIDESGPETLDRGIELDLRYNSPNIFPDGTPEVEWTPERYVPSTRPGSRVPHVFLKDGKTSTYDLLRPEWTLVHFVDESADSPNTASASDKFLAVAADIGFPVSRVVVSDEPHARQLWERNVVLVRPDTHVAWRGDRLPDKAEDIEKILRIVLGREEFEGFQPSQESAVAEERYRALVQQITDVSAGSTAGATIAEEDI